MVGGNNVGREVGTNGDGSGSIGEVETGNTKKGGSIFANTTLK